MKRVSGVLFSKNINLFLSANQCFNTNSRILFWENDPGEGSGLPLVAFDGSFNEAIEVVLSNNINFSSKMV